MYDMSSTETMRACRHNDQSRSTTIIEMYARVAYEVRYDCLHVMRSLCLRLYCSFTKLALLVTLRF